jgi:hypothetical protein
LREETTRGRPMRLPSRRGQPGLIVPLARTRKNVAAICRDDPVNRGTCAAGNVGIFPKRVEPRHCNPCVIVARD